MPLTLDLYTKKKRLYYIGLVITLTTFSFIALAGIYNLDFQSPLMPLYDTLLIIATFISMVFFVIAGLGLLKIYIKDGDLTLSSDYIVIDDLKIQMTEVSEITLKLAERSIKSHILIRNRIILLDKSGNIYNRRFAIISNDQNEEFESLLGEWRNSHVPFKIA